jgi:hypothetical protein
MFLAGLVSEETELELDWWPIFLLAVIHYFLLFPATWFLQPAVCYSLLSFLTAVIAS